MEDNQQELFSEPLKFKKATKESYDGKNIDASLIDEQAMMQTPMLDKALLQSETPTVIAESGESYDWNKHLAVVEPQQRAYVGIDNGISGSIGIIYEDGTYGFFKTPTKSCQDYTKKKKNVTRVIPTRLFEIFSKVGEGSMVMIERPMINSTRFHASMSAIRAFEATITVLETLGLPYEVCDSKEWQKPVLPIGVKGDDLKKASLDVGNRLFPKTKSVKHADCDGILIAYFCKTKHK